MSAASLIKLQLNSVQMYLQYEIRQDCLPSIVYKYPSKGRTAALLRSAQMQLQLLVYNYENKLYFTFLSFPGL